MPGIGEASEDECAICGAWPLALRPAMREDIEQLPVREPLCKAWVIAFWHNCVGPVSECPGPLLLSPDG
jgi:hypothetical protein